MKSVLIFITSITFCLSGYYKSKLVQVEYELDNASYISDVVIVKYENQKIWFTEIGTHEKKSVNVTPYAGNGNTRGFGYTDGFMTGFWPAIGDTLLIVSDSNNRISMFANIMTEDYSIDFGHRLRRVVLLFFHSRLHSNI